MEQVEQILTDEARATKKSSTSGLRNWKARMGPSRQYWLQRIMAHPPGSDHRKAEWKKWLDFGATVKVQDEVLEAQPSLVPHETIYEQELDDSEVEV